MQTSITYSELLAWARCIAGQVLGACETHKVLPFPGLLVALHLDRSTLALAAVLAVWEAGGAYIPVPKDLPLSRRLALSSEAALVVTDVLEEGMLSASCLKLLLIESSVSEAAFGKGFQRAGDPDPDEVCMVIYTSGSTGRPKGVVCDHTCLWHSVRCFTEDLGEEHCRRLLWKTPYQWRTAEYEMFPALCLGGCTFITPDGCQKCSSYLTEAIRSYEIGALAAVPSVLTHLLEPLSECGSLTHVVAIGEPLPRRLCSQALQKSLQLSNYYGLTETGMTTWRCRAVPEGHFAPVGRPQPATNVALLDAAGKPSRQGEVFFSGIMFRGYLNRPKLTEERLREASLYGKNSLSSVAA